MTDTGIDVFYTGSVLAYTDKLNEYFALLDTEEQQIALRFKFAELKQRYIICHGILRELLAARVGEPAAQLGIVKTAYGKPYLADFPQLSFNMSHTGDCLAIAISSQCNLGIDIECFKQRNTWSGLVNKCFAQQEVDYWYALDATERGQVFYQFWVKKEAFVKAVGQGITLGLNQCVVNPAGLGTFLAVPEQCTPAEQWQIYTLDLPVNIFGAVVCDEARVLHFHALSRLAAG
ncbi:MAG: 4'-phosphopantetheinyl transferase [Methyloprofundus sp.]|nr:MAG: 4'-phosphopantetheinyl transferase [Methyloprofundus sp.]